MSKLKNCPRCDAKVKIKKSAYWPDGRYIKCTQCSCMYGKPWDDDLSTLLKLWEAYSGKRL